MHTAIVEFNPLPDTVGPATQNHDLALVGFRDFVLIPVGGIKIRGIGLKLRGAGVNEPEGR